MAKLPMANYLGSKMFAAQMLSAKKLKSHSNGTQILKG